MSKTRPPAKRQVTILDIARETGLSKSTVSRALNTPTQVAAEALQKIQAAIQTLNYIPDSHARSLVTQRSFAFAAVVPTLDNAIFAALMRGFQGVMAEHGFHVLVAANDYSAKAELDQLRTLAQLSIGGVMLVGASRDPEAYRFLDSRRIPYVLTSAYDGNVPSIGWDNEAEARRLADHLLDLGHRRLAVIGGITLDNDRAAARIAGYHAAMRARGVEPDPALTLECPYDIPSSRAAMRRLLDQPQRPTAVLCGNDVQAFGAILECHAQGVRIPQDISITGFDDLEMAAHFQPALTTMRSPAAQMGRRAADMLLAVNEGRPMPASTRLDLELILRRTTGPAPVPPGAGTPTSS
ncbi:MAG: LacI family DNA-binding transcriptional regulator [Gammaproteobacteria bacterium]|nr:LacI family DNA-binding transcriptional regulator [Gammaproteobacteria bacterium]MBU1442010.1 LacI family DNA-binding transcriptional regulator [Gammaproteobacteria bacterium]MBU2285818.1 LacI family DNA-binding transcriptional regulator [Gammaproteobacteria bacterium]